LEFRRVLFRSRMKELPGFLESGRISTWMSRVQSFAFEKNSVDHEDNYQINQAKIAIAKGGLLGEGPGNSTQRNFLPHPYSDFIYAIIIERSEERRVGKESRRL